MIAFSQANRTSYIIVSRYRWLNWGFEPLQERPRIPERISLGAPHPHCPGEAECSHSLFQLGALVMAEGCFVGAMADYRNLRTTPRIDCFLLEKRDQLGADHGFVVFSGESARKEVSSC